MDRRKEDPDVTARLQEECRNRGWNQAKLMNEIGISRSFVSQLWNGSVPLGTNTLRKLALKGFDLNWLITGKPVVPEEVFEEMKLLKFYIHKLESLVTMKGSEDDESREKRGPGVDQKDQRLSS